MSTDTQSNADLIKRIDDLICEAYKIKQSIIFTRTRPQPDLQNLRFIGMWQDREIKDSVEFARNLRSTSWQRIN